MLQNYAELDYKKGYLKLSKNTTSVESDHCSWKQFSKTEVNHSLVS